MKKLNSGKSARKKLNSPTEPDNQQVRDYGFSEIKPLNYIQSRYLESMKNNNIVFGIGSAGTGKTFLAANYAAGLLFHRNVQKIVITRPNVEAGRSLGFLPGELEEKYAPYLEPFNDCFKKFLGKSFYEYCLKTKIIEPIPLGFMRGRSFDDTFILADEMQNATKTDMMMFLSRIGKNSKIIVSGDPRQCDIQDSGLEDATNRLSKLKGVEVVEFLSDDIVRSPLCKQIIIAYSNLY